MPASFGFLSTYPPTQCGLATFTASLRAQLEANGHVCGVVRVLDDNETTGSGPEVVHHLVPGSPAAQVLAGLALDTFDVVVVQHEFGIYGGLDGDEILALLDNVTAPVIVVTHTVLTTPTLHQRAVLERVLHRADAVVAMTRTARSRLLAHYDVDAAKVSVIPHGAHTAGDRAADVRTGPPTILTWGLIGPGKGIEAVIDVLPRLRALGQPVRYRVVGQTHPRVLERDGEVYRDGLKARAAALGVEDLVSFEASYLDAASLQAVVAQADLVVLPYESTEQVTSGVLIEAVAAGKPVVATAFPHAVELLAGGAGLVVGHGDPQALTTALHRVLADPALAASMAGQSGQVAPDLMWPAVADRYRGLADRLVDTHVSLMA